MKPGFILFLLILIHAEFYLSKLELPNQRVDLQY